METALDTGSTDSPTLRWSIYAGGYMFVCGLIVALLLSDMLTLLAEVIGLPVPYSIVILASPTLFIGAVTWWLVVERPGSYTYRLGGFFGLATALLTGLLWTIRFVGIWGFEMLSIPIVSLLVVFVFGVVVIAGSLSGLPLMYARRRLNGEGAD